MRKGVGFILCILVISMLVLGGCADKNVNAVSSETRSDNVVDEEESEALSVLETENTQPPEKLTYEYETQELYARRDENQIYGVVYIPQDAGGQLPGAGHGLHGQDAETATEYMLEYLQAHCR